MKTAYCFDLDGTITKEEILPLLSQEIGLYEEIKALTEATIKGIIPFEKSFLLRCRLLSEIPISKVQRVIDQVSLHEDIIRFIKSNEKNTFVVTGNLRVWLKPLIEKIGCCFYCSEANHEDDHLLSVSHVLEKSDVIKKLRKDFDRIIVVGDGMGDVRMFEEVDVGIAYGGVHQPIDTLIKLSNFVTYEEKSLCRLLNTL